MIKKLLGKIPAHLEGDVVQRKDKCNLCGENSGKLLSVIDYWDIRETSLVKCETCGLAQLDPMLTDEDTSTGCLAYYIEESLRCPVKGQENNLLRNFRRGVLFAYSLRRRKLCPAEILEFGPGSGYFLQGIRFVFPDVRITVMDINQEVLSFNKTHHGYEIVLSTPEEYLPGFADKFDLIIARDIIEHVSDISKMIGNVIKYSCAGGLFHFITPNGHEDLWKHYLTHKYLRKHSELLINHVNYFDGKGLLNYLKQKKFVPVEYYNFTFKTTLRGRGWKVKSKLMAEVSQKKNAGYFINEKISEVRNIDFDKKKILDKWYISEKRKFVTFLMSWYHHATFIHIDPAINIGHETYGLFRIP